MYVLGVWPSRAVTFIDNHDIPRFLYNAPDERSLEAAAASQAEQLSANDATRMAAVSEEDSRPLHLLERRGAIEPRVRPMRACVKETWAAKLFSANIAADDPADSTGQARPFPGPSSSSHREGAGVS